MNTRLALLGFALLAGVAQAADPYPQQQYPQQQYPQQFQQQQGSQAHPMRTLFAQSLASVAQTTGSAAIVAVADGLTGALKGWFDNRRQKKGANGALGGNNYAPNTMQAGGYPAPTQPQGYPAPATDANGYPLPNDPNANTGGYPPASNYPAPDNGYPADAGAPAGGYPANNYPANTYPANTYPQPASQTPATLPPSQLYAGIAYEIHLLQRDGSTVPVDPLNYTFRTGDQFRVFYRPSLPGRVDVYNINAAGQEAQIDTSVIAAGELASLGPYEFTQLQGDETLILKLSPCVTPALYATTRNIVKVQSAQTSYPQTNAMGFESCSNTSTRGLKTKTRDIRKVAVEGGTSFALDPIGANELGGGDMAPRQVTITLMHR